MNYNFPQQNQQNQWQNPNQAFQKLGNQIIQTNKNQQLGQNKPQMQFVQGNPQQFQFQPNEQNQQNLQNQKNIQPQNQGLNQNQGQQQFQNFGVFQQMNNNSNNNSNNINNNINNNNIKNNAAINIVNNNNANKNLPFLNNQNIQQNFQQNNNLKQQANPIFQNQYIQGDCNQKPSVQSVQTQNNQLQFGNSKQFETFNPKPPDLQGKFQVLNMTPMQQPQMLPNTQQQKYQTVEVNNEEDRKQLVKNLNQYIKDGNPFFVFECLKQILQNDIRIKFPENLSNYK